MTFNPPKVWEVVPYRAEWLELFAREAQLLAVPGPGAHVLAAAQEWRRT